MNNFIDKPPLYVGCALTESPQEFKDKVELLKAELAEKWEVMRFLGLTDGTSADVYTQDIDANVRRCSAFTAIADYPATGLGVELGVADEREVPTLILAHEHAKVSRLLIGSAAVRDHITFMRYKEWEEIPEMINEVLYNRLKEMRTEQ